MLSIRPYNRPRPRSIDPYFTVQECTYMYNVLVFLTLKYIYQITVLDLLSGMTLEYSLQHCCLLPMYVPVFLQYLKLPESYFINKSLKSSSGLLCLRPSPAATLPPLLPVNVFC